MAKETSVEDIRKSVSEGRFSPVYLFHGEEEYFIDLMAGMVIERALKDEERDFNQTVFYGADTRPPDVINACRRFPVMAERQLVVLREAQNMKEKDIEELVLYVSKPVASTVLVICYKHGKLDGRKRLSQEIAKHGTVVESKKLYDNQIIPFIISYLKQRKVEIEDRAAQLIADCLGVNISRLVNELEKIIIGLPENSRRITVSLVEHNIGINRDFNNFELQRAIAKRDVLKANRIAQYFGKNPKNNPLVVTLSVLFNFFSNLMICHYERDRSINGVKQALGLRFDMQAYDYIDGMRNYNAMKTMNIIALIRSADVRSKGFGNSSLTDEMLLKELIYMIMH
jgi:DNA polymerase-3 subunit delta